MTPFGAALLGLALNEAAYMAEIVRGGLLSVGRGQTEAALSLGMSKSRTIRRIVFPQAMRAIIPPAGNELITCLKTTALVSVISYPELLGTVQGIYSVNYKTLELLVVASIWYLTCTTAFSIVQYYVEHSTERVHHGVAGQVSVPAGTTRETTYRFGAPEPLLFGCHIPGHYAYGMRGTIAVT